MSDWVENKLQAKGLKYWAHFPSFQIKPRKCSAAKNVWHHFWKDKRCLCWSNRPKGSLKKVFWEILQNSQENMCRNLFFW